MSGKKHLAVISSQMDRLEKYGEKTNGKDVSDVKKVEEPSEPQSLQIPVDGDIPIFTEEFLNYNKGNEIVISKVNSSWVEYRAFPWSLFFAVNCSVIKI